MPRRIERNLSNKAPVKGFVAGDVSQVLSSRVLYEEYSAHFLGVSYDGVAERTHFNSAEMRRQRVPSIRTLATV